MGLDWEYFSFYSFVSPGFRQEASEDAVELILKFYYIAGRDAYSYTDQRRIRNTPAYATGDLLQPHPTKPGFWKFFVVKCRGFRRAGVPSSSNISHSFLVERVLMMHHLIAGAVIFGPRSGTSVASLNAYKDLVWPAFECCNDIAPGTAKLTNERVLVASLDKPFTYGEKCMPRRKEVIAMYDAEIKSLA
ncbi:hypothetical protein CPB84DRAFT_1782092 [Gymnopilus junonius]|uniref:Uncharacterized protein n=1 Tax=Gymnopilus junonius TaxID=109634 RepID=A0A9P5TL18_GYMJU|nr:hypothetical protein CPB84DRAFT_1782092 [Gymnopilus junonius]